jgi:1-acyl-sn-glycerol-3-phosphate acyltransferase
MPTLDQLRMLARFGACVLAGLPSTTLVPLPLTLALTTRYRREELLKRLHLMVQWARFCTRHVLDMSILVEGRHHLPRDTRGYMYVSNHQSYVDILLLMDVLDTVAFLSKGLIKFIPVIGQCAYAGGTIYFDRRAQGSRQQALRETIRMCQESTAVVIFPEGTRSFDGELRQKIHPGSVKAAYVHKLKVIPVGLDGTRRVVPKTMDRVGLGQTVAVTVGESIDSADFDSARAFVDAVWGRIGELFQESRARLGG